tara:strand:- start:1327 stop:2877 length:1551 start_codon:yes stop_codon:yes gene_type:complete
MSADLLLGTVSDFWKNHFKDYEAVKALVQGVFSSSSDSYNRLSTAAVSRSIDSAVLTRRTKHKLLSISRHKLLLRTASEGADTFLQYILEIPSQVLTIPSIVSSVGGSPTTRLLLGEDYSINTGDDLDFKSRFMSDFDMGEWVKEGSKYLVFNRNPLGTLGAQKSSMLVQDYYRLDVTSDDDAWRNVYVTGKEVLLSNNSYSRVLTVLNGNSIILEPSSPASLECSSLSDENSGNTILVTPRLFTLESKTCHLIANDYVEDTEYLYNHFGYRYSSVPSKSTEHYRKILKAKALLNTAPPTRETLLSACNLFLGMPVFEAGSEVGEQLLSSTTQANSNRVKVATTLADYIVESAFTLRTEVVNSLREIDGAPQTNVQELEFDKLEPLCSDIEVFTGTDTEWWYDNNFLPKLPLDVAPGLESDLDRKVIQGDHLNQVGSPDGQIPQQRVGDYHFQVGDATRKVLATALTEDFLKWKLVGIKVSDTVKNLEIFFQVSDDLIESIQKSLPVGTLLLHNLS